MDVMIIMDVLGNYYKCVLKLEESKMT